MNKKLGQVAAGFQSDFILTTGNPIENLSILQHPKAVSKPGRWYTGEQLNAKRDELIASRSIWQELHTLFEAM